MKRFLSILLILITALYVLPVTDGLKSDIKMSGKYVDNKCEDSKDEKKDTGKEFISTDVITPFLKNTAANQPASIPVFITPVHFALEIPPPNKA